MAAWGTYSDRYSSSALYCDIVCSSFCKQTCMACCAPQHVSQVMPLGPTVLYMMCNICLEVLYTCLQVQEEGLMLPDALVWQVLWEVAQVRAPLPRSSERSCNGT